MKLQNFVSQTLFEIMAGVRDAQGMVGEFDARINPYRGSATATRDIEFDVEVTTSEATNTKSGFGVFVGAVAAGAQGQSGGETRSVGRIRFTVFVEMPTHPSPRA